MKEFDAFKPRFTQTKYRDVIINENMYKEWCKENPSLSSKIISFAAFKRYWMALSDGIKEEVCKNPLGVKLPFHCGELVLKYVGGRLKAIDIKKSAPINMKVPFLNWHSGEKTGKLVWNVERASRFNMMLKFYGFKGCREFNVQCNKALLNIPETFKTIGAKFTDLRDAKDKAREVINNRENEYI